MEINKRLTKWMVTLALVCIATAARATPVELVVNGEFEVPDVGSNTWEGFDENAVPGWSTTGPYFEIWGSNFAPDVPLPANGTDDISHGQHHEIAYNSSSNLTIQDILITSDGFVDFSFDTWRRYATSISYTLTGSLSGTLANGTFEYADNDWYNISASGLSVSAGETFTMQFQSAGSNCCGAHIDQVSLLYTAVPEPTALALLGLGLAGIGFSARKKKATA